MQRERLDSKELAIGMYVAELDRPWVETSFLFQGFRITNPGELEQLQSTCAYVYVDVEKSRVPIPQHLKTIGAANNEEPLQHDRNATPAAYQCSFEQEFKRAKPIYQEALSTVHEVFSDIRLGKNINVPQTRNTVIAITNSIMRHPDAMLLMSRLNNRNSRSIDHAINVCILSLTLGRYMGLEPEQLFELGMGALLHDIGELRLADESANPTDDEDEVMRQHPEQGVRILEESSGISNIVMAIVQDHHERNNQTGYPRKLGSKEIGFYTKLVSIVDVYETVTGNKPGASGISCTDALKSMYDWRDKLFDADLIEQFIQCLGIYPVGSVVQLNTREVGVVISVSPNMRLLPTVMLVRDKNQQPYEPPRIINLAQHTSEEGHNKYEVTQVVEPESFGIDLRGYILREMDFQSSITSPGIAP